MSNGNKQYILCAVVLNREIIVHNMKVKNRES